MLHLLQKALPLSMADEEDGLELVERIPSPIRCHRHFPTTANNDVCKMHQLFTGLQKYTDTDSARFVALSIKPELMTITYLNLLCSPISQAAGFPHYRYYLS